MSLSKLSKLPPEVLSSVLNNEAIPLRRRLHLRLLCNRWADIIEDGLKKETSLVIRDYDARNLKPKPDILIIKYTDPMDEFTRPLSRLFTSLTKLTVDFGDEDSWDTLPSLFTRLDTASLTTIKLYSHLTVVKCYDMVFANEPIDALAIAAALTAISGLTSLTLFGYGLVFQLQPHLQCVLSRVEKFSCADDSVDSDDLYDDSDDLFSILSTSLSPRYTHLCLQYDIFESLENSFRVELANNLTHLHLFNCDGAFWYSIYQINRLSSLTLQFTTAYTALNFFHLFLAARFTRLTQVKLYGCFDHTSLALPMENETPLSTVKHFTLEVNFGDSPVDCQAFFQGVSAWFPNLDKLTLLTAHCIIPAIEASLGKLPMTVPFAVEIEDRDSVDTWIEDW